MNIELEQGLAAVVRYVQDHGDAGTKLYFDEIPERFCVPSVYFQVPVTSGRKATLRSYGTRVTMYIWFMAAADWDAYARVADMRDCIMLDGCRLPVVDEAGGVTGRALLVSDLETKRIDEGIVQLSFSFEVYFHPESDVMRVQKLYAAWREAGQGEQ